LSKNASEADKEIAARGMLTYTKATQDGSYKIAFDGEEVTAIPFESREVMQAYTIL
jgi:hypothetical protein